MTSGAQKYDGSVGSTYHNPYSRIIFQALRIWRHFANYLCISALAT